MLLHKIDFRCSVSARVICRSWPHQHDHHIVNVMYHRGSLCGGWGGSNAPADLTVSMLYNGRTSSTQHCFGHGRHIGGRYYPPTQKINNDKQIAKESTKGLYRESPGSKIQRFGFMVCISRPPPRPAPSKAPNKPVLAVPFCMSSKRAPAICSPFVLLHPRLSALKLPYRPLIRTRIISCKNSYRTLIRPLVISLKL